MNSFILFDFDGTIADTISAGLEIINSHAEKYGYKRLDGDINTHFSALQLVKLAEVKLWKLPYLIYQLKKKLSEKSDELKVLPEAPGRPGILQEMHIRQGLSRRKTLRAARGRAVISRHRIMPATSGRHPDR